MMITSTTRTTTMTIMVVLPPSGPEMKYTANIYIKLCPLYQILLMTYDIKLFRNKAVFEEN